MVLAVVTLTEHAEIKLSKASEIIAGPAPDGMVPVRCVAETKKEGTGELVQLQVFTCRVPPRRSCIYTYST